MKWAVSPDGRPSPGPYKRATIRRYAKKFRTPILVETGTLYGDTIASELTSFRKIVSIEIDPTLAEQARHRFASFDHVEILQGDSAVELPVLLPTLDAPTLFWLDGHYSGAGTGRSDLDSPIVAEVEAILRTALASIVLIDDARLFVGTDGYPTRERLTETVASLRPSATVSLSRDIFRIVAMHSWDISPNK